MYKILISFLFFSFEITAQSEIKEYRKCTNKSCTQIERLMLMSDNSAIFQRISDSSRGSKFIGKWHKMGDSLIFLAKENIETAYAIKLTLDTEFLISSSSIHDWETIESKLNELSQTDEDYVTVKNDQSLSNDVKRRLLKSLVGGLLPKALDSHVTDIYIELEVVSSKKDTDKH